MISAITLDLEDLLQTVFQLDYPIRDHTEFPLAQMLPHFCVFIVDLCDIVPLEPVWFHFSHMIDCHEEITLDLKFSRLEFLCDLLFS